MSTGSEESPLELPGWLKTHPEMQKCGVDLCQCVKPVRYMLSRTIEPVYAVKILSFDDEDQEAAIYRRLRHEQDPRNPVLPCEVLDLEPKPVLLMPFLSHIDEVELSYGPLSGLLSVFLQVVDGVQYLHERRIAHMDVCYGNILVALKEDEPQYNGVVAGKVYLIDFHTSRQLSSGPGVQHALPLPCTQVPPPPHLKGFDPYSWDAYCLGKFLERMVENTYAQGMRPPWVLRRAIGWLVGKERGCTGACNCRPTARKAYWGLRVLQWAVWACESCGILSPYIRYRPVRRRE
ncbi:hypothetical protein C8Q77DRAFT_1060556 [Trametes polyzona]|nr:hypothetical protein C8Q77DRAFT_1060556 [Trametes polyzona]